MPTPAATTPATHAPYRPRLSGVIGAAFVGCTLIAVISPAHAEPGPSAGIAFSSEADRVELGEKVPPNTLTVINTGGLEICLVGLQTDASEFPAGGLSATRLAPGQSATSTVSGTPVQETTVVTATLRYAASVEGRCEGIDGDQVKEAASNTWTVTATPPEPPPSPTPTETPTEEPTREPSPSPTPTREPSPSPTPTGEPTRTPDPTDDSDRPPATTDPGRPSPTPTATEQNPGGGSGGNERTGDNDRSPARTPDRSPAGTPDRTPPRSSVGSVPTSGADIPTLPRDEADLPELSPGSPQDLAELPLVTPTSDEETGNETEIAADHSDLGPSIAPAVLLAAFLLALLLATPLAPTRRVRIGSGYQGRRRKG